MSAAFDRLFEPDQIRVLLAAAEAKSFSGAAARLGVSQPSISQQIKRIEQAAGRVLFRRTWTGVELNSDGEAVLIYARAMVDLGEDLRRHFQDTAGVVKLAVGMSEDFCRTALPTVLWLFLREHPLIEMRIVSGSFEMLLAAVEARTVDLAVMRRHAGVLDVKPLWTDKVHWVGRADLALPIADPVPLILPIGPSPMREALIGTLRAHGRTWRVPFESHSLASIEAALQAGLGVCASPRGMRFIGVSPLDSRCGLPALPDVEFVMSAPDHKVIGPVAAFAEVMRQAAISSFQLPEPLAR